MEQTLEQKPSPSEDQIIEEKIKAFVDQLAEFHTVNVRVFVTGSWAGLSRGYNWGSGDFYSTMGYVREWLLEQEARVHQRVMAETGEET